MVIRMRSTRSHTRTRRAHHALREGRFLSCPKCKEPVLPHTACLNCGIYKGKEVIDVLKKLTKKERKQKEKELKAQEEEKREKKPLDAVELSKK
ncbi:50S ribosomal protein L32 [Patescibacteria group bacterium]|nr:50S ribosomal protein L32 [Patescibacteria group bacterium]MBU2219199.1 50S ribosomal protein L32 [Patescibacteria group bacterium]MBU2263149.1 50S ribosomal protein L32 [Patescibacteria group bacterium]